MPKPEYGNNLQVITDDANQVKEVSFIPRSMSGRSLRSIFVAQMESTGPKEIFLTMPKAEVFVSKDKLNQIKEMAPKSQRSEIKRMVRWMAYSDEVSVKSGDCK